MRRRISVAAILVVACVFGTLAQAQDNPKPANSKKNPYSGSPLTWTIDPILDNYVSQMTRYYNLTQDQEAYTRQLLTQRVKDFLRDYETDVRSLFTEYWALQLRGEAPSKEEAQDLARRGAPLIAAIKKEILDGNQQWREILDENQRKIHDRDLDQMGRTFDDLQDKLNRWSKGDVRPTDVGARTIGPKPGPIRKPEDAWEFKVNSFIREYNLDAGQQETARSIMRELREEAGRYRERNQEKFADLEAKQKEILNSDAKTDPEEKKKAMETVKKLNEERTALERPIREEMWRQLLSRLDRIPTEDQRRAYKEKQDRLRIRLAGGKGPSSRTSTQPESSRPATTNPAAAVSAQ